MKDPVEIHFVAQNGDKLGEQCLTILAKEGYSTSLLNGEAAPVGSIAFYGCYPQIGKAGLSFNDRWPSRYLRACAIDLDIKGRPEWTLPTPFVLAV